jgi:hypothetical protein
MKKLLFKSMMVVAMAATLVACEKDDETTGGTSGASIVGTWDQTSEKTTYSINGQVIEDTTIIYPADSFLITFTSTGVAYSNDGDTLQYSLNNGKLTLISNYGGQYDTAVMNANVTATNLTLSFAEVDTFQGQTFNYSSIANFRRK